MRASCTPLAQSSRADTAREIWRTSGNRNRNRPHPLTLSYHLTRNLVKRSPI